PSYFIDSDNAAVQTFAEGVVGALRLYLDFINLFIMLMHLMGQQR
ncbi:MAG TPA: BAX inhibitor (BI)-1/YccA family protein, partial [Alphaproteobacteria bacterium]|nr:BAX inhibitor (BI)-1/YccA family protein [Alphaproteobacteria bacterium]